MEYRQDIDGLRALAIIPVILYHINHEYFANGFLGVDVFFVISGYLVGSIIYTKSISNSFNFFEFYYRRIKRIMPLYFLVSLMSALASLALFAPSQIKDTFQAISASVSFVSNFFFYREIDYFNPFTELSPLIHTWSLSIEEQFYLFLPFLILFSRRKKVAYFLLSSTILFSLTLYFYYYQEDQSWAFYSSITRFWELLAGVFFGIFSIYNKSMFKKPYFNYLSITAFCITLIILKFNVTFLSVSYARVIIVLSTLALIASKNSSVNTKLLSKKFLVHIGLISYSLYLIHQPILSFIRFSGIGINGCSSYLFDILTLCLIYILSILSYNYFERPIRYLNIKKKNVFIMYGFLTFLFFSAGYVGHITNGFESYFEDKYQDTFYFSKGKEHKLKEQEFLKTKNAESFDISTKNIIVIGDSQAGDVFLSLKRTQATNERIKLLSIDDLCFDKLSNYIKTKECSNKCLNKYSSEELEMIESSDLIILSALWSEESIQKCEELVSTLNVKTKKPLFVIGGASFFEPDLIAIQQIKRKIPIASFPSYCFNNYINEESKMVSVNLEKHLNNKAIYINKLNFFISDEQLFLFDKNKKPRIWDTCHLTVNSLEDFGKYLRKSLTI